MTNSISGGECFVPKALPSQLPAPSDASEAMDEHSFNRGGGSLLYCQGTGRWKNLITSFT